MNLQQTTSIVPQTNLPDQGLALPLIWRLAQHLFCVSLGIVGGGSGVAVVIGAAVLIQAVVYAPAAFLPNVTLLTVIAVLAGLAISWLLSLVARRLLPNFRYSFNTLNFQIILISSALTSLLENYLFMHNISALSAPTNTVWVDLTYLFQAIV